MAKGSEAARLALLLTFIGVVPVGAQERPDTVRAIPINPIEVSVLRSPIEAGREPYPVSSLGVVALQQGKTAAFLEEALEALPGVQVQNRFNYAVGERLSIRGFGPRAQFGVRGVRVMIDGIPATFPDGQSALEHVDLASLGRVEVLRGPASALYGNAAGGVLTFQTRTPYLERFRQEGRIVLGSHGLANLMAITSGTAGGTGYLLSLNRLDYDGFRRNAAVEGQTYGAAERWGGNANVQRAVGSGRLTLAANFLDLDAENPGALSKTLLDQQGSIAFAGNVNARTGKTIRQGQLGAAWNGSVGSSNAEVAAWGITREVRNPIPGTIIDLDRAAGGARALLRGDAETGAGALTWGAGAEIELQRDDRRNFENQAGQEGRLTLDQLENVVATGGFVQARLAPLPRIEVTGALRYDRFSFDADDRFVAQDGDDSGERVMDAVSPSLGVFFDVAGALGAYASVSTSLETPTTTELTNRPDGGGGFNPELDPQRATTWEAGVRGSWVGRLAYELTFFYTDLTNELVPFEDETQQGRVFYRNAGSSTHKGAEAAVRAALSDFLGAQVSFSRVDARFDDYTVRGVSFAGNRVPGLAPNRLEALLDAQVWRAFGDVSVEWMDDIPVNDALPADVQYSPSYALLHLRAGTDELRAGGLALKPFVGVSNVFDKAYNSAVTVNAFGGRYFEPGPGRTFHFGLSAAVSR
jgi:iron complex outermembrane receptor protein